MPRPTDCIDILEWVNARRADLDAIERKALFDARMQGRFDRALIVTGLSRKRATALTRAENVERGTQVRWGGR